MRRLFLIDGTAMAYRSHFAFATGSRGGLTTADGRPTSAIYGFTLALQSLLAREQPDAIAVSFDGPVADLERTKIYPEYKSTRQKMPEELFAQLETIEKIVEAYCIPIIRCPGQEADDVIGTLAVRGREAGMKVFIVTGDKDFMQLVDEHLALWNLRGSAKTPDIIGPAEVEAKFGVRPEQIIDLLALMGDSSDNVPGVPRIGPKTAASLLQARGTLAAVLAHAQDVKQPSIAKSLGENRHLAELSKRLVTIRTDLDLGIEIENLSAAKPDRDELQRLFRDLEFESLLASLPADQQIQQDYTIVRTEAELERLLADLREAGEFAFDTETTSLDPMQAELVGMSFSWQAGKAFYLPFNLDPPILAGGGAALLEKMRPVLQDPDLRKTIQNAKYDLGVLRHAGIELQGLAFDTMLASYVVNPGAGQHGLDALSLRYFAYKKIPTKELLGTGKKQITFDRVEIELAGRYAAEDADFTWRLKERLSAEVEKAGVGEVLDELEMPLIKVLLDMEWEGIALDREHLRTLGLDLGKRLAAIEQKIQTSAGEPFNLNSPAQIGEILFRKLEVHRAAGMDRPRKTKTGQFRTDAATLEKLARCHEVPRLLLEYRKLAKLANTYVESLPEMVNAQTGRIHTSFNQAVAATGRLSSDHPNLQNIPIRSEEGREVRRAFISRAPSWVLLSADYSQIELRILAHFSKDPALVGSFHANEDIHSRTAALVHGIMPGMVTPELRAQAKVINYGLIYGMGASRLANETGMTPPQAKQFIAAYFKALPGVKAFLDETLRTARNEGEVRTLFGRRRPLPDIDSQNALQRIAAENMAVNTPIQGTAADIIKRAMLVLHRELGERGMASKMILQVHDELVLDVPEEELEQAAELLESAMVGAADLTVPLVVSVNHGRSWLEAHA